MNKKLLEFIGIGLITGALMWGLVQASGVQVNNTPSIVDDGTTVTFSSNIAWEAGAGRTIETPDAANDTQGNSIAINTGDGGDCVSCSEGSDAGGAFSVFVGTTGSGSGSVAGGSGSTMILRAGGGGADGGAGGGAGGAVIIDGGAEANASGIDGTVQVSAINPGVIDLAGTRVRHRSPSGHDDDGLTLGVAAATWAATSNFQTMTGDGGGNTVTTITGGQAGQVLTLLFVDGNITITDDNAHTADTVDLSAAFVGADDTTLTLLSDGTSWYELSRSVN